MATLRKKFDIAYFIAKEKLAFSKMKPLCELEERHGADLGEKYKTNIRCAEFVAAIGQKLKKDLADALTTATSPPSSAMAQRMLGTSTKSCFSRYI